MSQHAVSAILHTIHHDDPGEAAKEVIDAVGNLDDFVIFGAQVLIGVYVRPATTRGGFIIGADTTLEDVWQGKVGLILKIGPTAFNVPPVPATPLLTNFPEVEHSRLQAEYARALQDRSEALAVFGGRAPQVGDWIYHRAQDAFQCSLKGPGSKNAKIKRPDGDMEDARKWQGWPCRLVYGADIYGRVALPQVIV